MFWKNKTEMRFKKFFIYLICLSICIYCYYLFYLLFYLPNLTVIYFRFLTYIAYSIRITMVILQVMQNNYMRNEQTKTKIENNRKFILPDDLIKAF